MPLRPDVAVVFPAAHQRGGVERVAWDLCHYLADQGTAVSFVGCTLADAADARITFEQVAPARGLPAPLAFKRAASRRLAELNPACTVTLGVECPPGQVMLVGSVHRSWLRRARTVPVAGREVSAKIRYLLPRHLLLLALERSYFRTRNLQAVLCCSENESADLGLLYGVPKQLRHVVPNSFDRRVFAPRPADMELRRKVAPDAEDVVLLFMGNELHRKGFSVLLDAVARAADARLKVAVVGRADPAVYARKIKQLGLDRRVTWYGPTDEAAAWYAASDLLVLPTQYEPFGLVIVEALATGLPVLTSRQAGAAAAVQHGVNGLLLGNPQDADELASLLRQALDERSRGRWRSVAADSVEAFEREHIMSRVDAFVRATAS